MTLKDVDYIEFFVADARRAAHFYSSHMGFQVLAEARPETGVEGRRSYLLQQGSMRMLLTSALTPLDPAAGYVERHGDGVKDIAFLTSHVERTFEEAVRRGARPVQEPEVYEGEGARVTKAVVASPIGDLVHTLVQREGRDGVFLPGHFRATFDFAVPHVEPFTALDHIAICLSPGTLQQTVRFYREVFDFYESHAEDVRSEYSGMNSRVVQSSNRHIIFPMMEPAPDSRRPGQLEEFLANHGGPGVQHLAMLSGDIAASIQALRKRGIELLNIPAAYYENLEERLGKLELDISLLRDHGILADRDSGGILLQTFTRSSHPRKTLFFEVVQRLNAVGFGSGNIRALFDAKERELARLTVAAP